MPSKPRKSIRWLRAAIDDLCEIIEHVATDNPLAAERLADSIFTKIKMLENLPHAGPVCPHYRKARQLVHGSYIIYYTVHKREVVIRAVVHGARLFRKSRLKRKK